MTTFTTAFSLLLCLLVLLLSEPCWSQKVAIIGGGVSGTFTTKYLVDFDRKKCKLDSITIFDPNPLVEPTLLEGAPNDDDEWQGSRVAAIETSDGGKVVEIGASIFHEANALVKEMIENDPTLELGKPFSIGKKIDITKIPTRIGLGIYDGSGNGHDADDKPFVYFSNNTDPWNTFWTVVRYNLDLYKVDKATKQAIKLFEDIPALLNNTEDPATFFQSPDEMWRYTKLIKLVHASFDRVLDAIWVSSEDSFLQKLPYQGSLRNELLTAINLINYNQGNSQINGMVGLASFAASQGPLYSVVGGNYQMISSAFQQAQSNRQKYCSGTKAEGVIQHQQQVITKVIGSMDGFELFGGINNTHLGTYDTVVLAAPLHQCRIQFLIPSQFDSAVLQPMPLADGMVDPEATDSDHEGHAILPHKLPNYVTRPYTQVVTTVVSGATLDHKYFGLVHASKLPRAICTTERGKANLHNITVISQITGDGVYKIFSSNKLDFAILLELFGSNHKVEYVKVWGGKFGGATPDYRGQGKSIGYLLYDGATGLGGHTTAGALYYPNAIETSLACMEASAIGAKSVAKLVARRLDILIPELRKKHDGEEL